MPHPLRGLLPAPADGGSGVRKGRPWTEANIMLLRELWAAGVRVGEIAERLKRTRSATIVCAHRMGLKRRPRHDSWSDKDIAHLEKLLDMGVSIDAMAAVLGCSKARIRTRLKRDTGKLPPSVLARASISHPDKDRGALGRADRDNGQRARRRCLGCGSTFLSEWKGNRMCGRCKNLDSYRGAVA